MHAGAAVVLHHCCVTAAGEAWLASLHWTVSQPVPDTRSHLCCSLTLQHTWQAYLICASILHGRPPTCKPAMPMLAGHHSAGGFSGISEEGHLAGRPDFCGVHSGRECADVSWSRPVSDCRSNLWPVRWQRSCCHRHHPWSDLDLLCWKVRFSRPMFNAVLCCVYLRGCCTAKGHCCLPKCQCCSGTLLSSCLRRKLMRLQACCKRRDN